MDHGTDCSVTECNKPAKRNGFCYAHDRRRRLGQPMGTPVRSWGSGAACVVEGCGKAAKARGHCPAHYRRMQRGKAVDTPLRLRRGADATCEVDGCRRPHRAGGMCTMHHQRMRRMGEPGQAESMVAAAGSGYVNPDGYRVFWVDGKNVFEHRMVMERLLDRKLEPFETVHHKNGIRHDNRPGNLELWVVPQPYGQRPEDLVAWVVEHYPDLVRATLETGTPCP